MVVVSVRPDRRIAHEAKRAASNEWLRVATEGLLTTISLRGAIESLMKCSQHLNTLIQTQSGSAENLVEIAESWKAERLQEALDHTKELGERLGDILGLTKGMQQSLQESAVRIDEASRRLHDLLQTSMPK